MIGHFYHAFSFDWVKSHYTTSCNGYFYTGFWISARTLWLVTQLEVTKTDNLTLSPRSSCSLISSKNDSTMSLASRLFSPTFQTVIGQLCFS